MNRHQTIQHILKTYHTIAVVGFSSSQAKAGYYVPEYMQRHGYQIIPVNPYLVSALGQTAYPTLRDIPQPVEVVQIFRQPHHVVPFVVEAIEIGAKAIWLQLDIINEAARQLAEEAGLLFVQDSCMLVEHRHLSQYEGAF
jgi:predicted CoA-binding protein